MFGGAVDNPALVLCRVVGGMRDAKGKKQPGHPVRVVAKTGTLNFTSALAGYILPPGGRR